MRRSNLRLPAKQLLLAWALLFCPSAVPRMASSGGERWFVPAVPDPQRFRLDEHRSRAPAATRIFGFPFVFYFEVGREFTTNEGYVLFWPSTYHQPALKHRVSLAALLGDLATAAAAAALLLFAAQRSMTKARPDLTQNNELPARSASADNPYQAPQGELGS